MLMFFYSNGIEILSRKFRLDNQDSVFKAELLAIIKVIDYIIELNRNECYSIITDSRSVLECICNIHEDRAILVKLINKIQN